MLARTEDDRRWAQLVNRLDEALARLVTLEDLVKKRLPAPPQPASKNAPAATADSA